MEIPLVGKKGKGLCAIVDDEDYEMLSQYKWHIGGGYATSDFGMRMHRLIMMPPDNLTIDHINRNRLDNRKSNLRICSQAENNKNKVCKPATKGGVYKHGNKWFAMNRMNGKYVRSRSYSSKREALDVLKKLQEGINPKDI